jgi:hypothetical protein
VLGRLGWPAFGADHNLGSRFALDSLLEESRFELLVPLRRGASVDAKAAQETGPRTEVAGHRQAGVLRLGFPATAPHAPSGGIRVSRVVRDQVRDRLDQRSWNALSHSTGDQRFDSRLLQEEMVTRIYNCVELTRHAGTLLLLEDDGRPGAKGRQSGRQRPIGEVDRANQNRLAPSRQMRLVYP